VTRCRLGVYHLLLLLLSLLLLLLSLLLLSRLFSSVGSLLCPLILFEKRVERISLEFNEHKIVYLALRATQSDVLLQSLEYIDVHYRISSGIDNNLRMNLINNLVAEIGGIMLNQGDVITYYFTYHAVTDKGKGGCDSEVFAFGRPPPQPFTQQQSIQQPLFQPHHQLFPQQQHFFPQQLQQQQQQPFGQRYPPQPPSIQPSILPPSLSPCPAILFDQQFVPSPSEHKIIFDVRRSLSNGLAQGANYVDLHVTHTTNSNTPSSPQNELNVRMTKVSDTHFEYLFGSPLSGSMIYYFTYSVTLHGQRVDCDTDHFVAPSSQPTSPLSLLQPPQLPSPTTDRTDIRCPGIEWEKQVTTLPSGDYKMIFKVVRGLSDPLDSVVWVDLHYGSTFGKKEKTQTRMSPMMSNSTRPHFGLEIPGSTKGYSFTYSVKIGSKTIDCDTAEFAL